MIPRHGHRSIWIEWPFSTLKLIQIELEVILLSWWWKFCHSHCLLSKLNQHLRTVIHLSTKLVLIIGVIYLTCMRKKKLFYCMLIRLFPNITHTVFDIVYIDNESYNMLDFITYLIWPIWYGFYHLVNL